jgi:hypothetical protein
MMCTQADLVRTTCGAPCRIRLCGQRQETCCLQLAHTRGSIQLHLGTAWRCCSGSGMRGTVAPRVDCGPPQSCRLESLERG